MHSSTDCSYDGCYIAKCQLDENGTAKYELLLLLFDCRKFGSLVTSKQIWLMQSKWHETLETFRIK